MAITNRAKLKRIKKQIEDQRGALSALLDDKAEIVKKIQERCNHKNSIMEWNQSYEDEYGSWTGDGICYRKCQKCGLEETTSYSDSHYGRGYDEEEFKALKVNHRVELIFIPYKVYGEKGWSVFSHWRKYDL